ARAGAAERRPRTVISKGTPGGGRQRNTVYSGGRQAVPGELHQYESAPKGGFGTTPVDAPSRYVYGGVNGGTDALDDLMTARRMPYTGHGPDSGQHGPARGSIRGALPGGSRHATPPDGLAQGDQRGAPRKAPPPQRHPPPV